MSNKIKMFITIKENSLRVPKKNFSKFDNIPLYKILLYKMKKFDIFVDTDSNKIIKNSLKDKNLDHVFFLFKK